MFSTGVWYTESSGDNLLVEITLKVQPGTGEDQPGGYAKVNGTSFGVQYIHHAYMYLTSVPGHSSMTWTINCRFILLTS
jgi:hypothetical protein